MSINISSKSDRVISIIPSTHILSSRYYKKGKRQYCIEISLACQDTIQTFTIMGQAFKQFLNLINLSPYKLTRGRKWIHIQDILYQHIANTRTPILLYISHRNIIYKVTREQIFAYKPQQLCREISTIIGRDVYSMERWDEDLITLWKIWYNKGENNAIKRKISENIGNTIIYLAVRHPSIKYRRIKAMGIYEINTNRFISDKYGDFIVLEKKHNIYRPKHLEQIITRVIENLPLYLQDIQDSRQYPLSRDKMISFIQDYIDRKNVTYTVKLELEKLLEIMNETVWDFANALSYIATHRIKKHIWKIRLQQLAGYIIEHPSQYSL